MYIIPIFYGAIRRIRPQIQGYAMLSGDDTLHLGADRKPGPATLSVTRGDDTLHLGADRKASNSTPLPPCGDDTLHLGADRKCMPAIAPRTKGDDTLHSSADRKHAIRRYTFRLYPNAGQAAQLEHLRRMSCRLYNALIEQRRDAWDRRKVSLTRFDQGREMTLLARDPAFPEWRSFPSAIRERVAERVDQAFKKYFDNVKAWRRGQWSKPWPPSPPRYQKGADFSGFGLREHGKGWRMDTCADGKGRVYIGGIGFLKIRGRFPIEPIALRTADVMWRNNHWEISIVAKFDETGLMRSPTRAFSNDRASNSLAKTVAYVGITCSNPQIAGEPQERSTTVDNRTPCSNPQIAGEPQGQQFHAPAALPCSNPQIAGKPQACVSPSPSRGRINAMRRWRNKIARRDHAIHEYTSWLAAHGGDIVIERPPLRQATATGAGTVYDPGALVAFKARMNRDLLDRGIGKFCEVLTYKVQARGRAVTVTERPDHSAMIPALATETARLAKRVQRIARRPGKSKEPK